ncbi:hypothetical protein N5C55_02965 [Pseudomonas otitidis]|uniref:hypothetical protein n=1 Tax=Metapseudomonas otitidis TaxID=319939 RepID=UPI00244979DB|nr:hypothetical protein [Pseudomonas otitidis]MDH1104839.1 hypothetical protein [Pseudomonas otitidis]MDH1157126.1 hypothetical protein [Pseudomonas otitidis]MDH1164750.1 hypothetical protein [Pseudomonas otitidis]
MQLNGSPINGAPLNGSQSRGAVAPPQTIAPVVSMIWSARLLLNGVDASHLLSGRITTRREEGARTIADFDLQFLDDAVNPATYQGQAAELWFRHWVGGAWVDHLVFRGKVTGPQFSLQTRVLSCECADQLNEQVELLDLATIDAITGGLWSADVFEAVEGRSRWDYASERMSTRPASLQLSLEGALQVTPWATSAPAWLIPAGTVLFQSVEWVPVELSDRINVVEIEADYRFSRLRERHQPFFWEHPDWVGLTVIDGFCFEWRHDSTEMPDIAMITEASQSAGYQAVINAGWDRLPPTGSGALCTPPSGWTLPYPDLLVRATWTSAMRWVQPVTEQYTLRVEAPASIAQAGEVVGRERLAFETENDRASSFEDAEFTGPEADAVQDALGDWVVDLREDVRLGEGMTCLLHVGRTRILGAHRGNRFVFQLPAADAMGIRLEHTLRVEDEVLGRSIACQAKVAAIAHEWDLDSGSALTTVELAVSQGGGEVSDPLTVPPIPASTPAGEAPALIQLPSQFSGHVDSPPYDEDLLGFAGNYTNYNSTQERFERRFDIEAPEIPADHRDEYEVPQVQTYRVVVPTDLLEL